MIMSNTILSFILIMNLNFILMKHPLALTLTIIIQTMLMCLLMGFLSYSSWFSYILFLIFLGGMLILFIYMTTLASNEMFSMPMKTIILSSLLIIIMTMLNTKLNYLFLSLSKQDSFTMNYSTTSSEVPQNLLYLYNFPLFSITISLMIYLLMTLIVVAKMTHTQEGALRHMS